MTKPAQVAFLSILDGTEAPRDTVWIFTANGTKGLEPRFLSRTRVLEFSLADDGVAAATFLGDVWRRETAAPVPDLGVVFRTSGCNLRDALMRLEVMLLSLPAETFRERMKRELAEAPAVQPAATKPGRWVVGYGGRSVWATA